MIIFLIIMKIHISNVTLDPTCNARDAVMMVIIKVVCIGPREAQRGLQEAHLFSTDLHFQHLRCLVGWAAFDFVCSFAYM